MGMFWNVEMIEEVVRKIDEYGFNCVIVDLVMIVKGGVFLLYDELVVILKELFILRSYVIMLNVLEVEMLIGMIICLLDD